MALPQKIPFPGIVTVFQEKRLPERALPVGYAALIAAYGLKVPLPRRLAAIGEHHKIYEEADWKIFTPRHRPTATLEGHLVFALKYEGLDLAVLKKLFESLSPSDLEQLIQAKPTSRYTRRLWFLYEWLMDQRLKLPDAKSGSYVPVVDPKQQWAVAGKNSTRHRVKDNLPGTREFCPLVFRSKTIDQWIALNLGKRAKKAIAHVPADMLARTAAFLLLQDSKSSYAIEGERPPQNRIQRWGRAIGEAGKQALDLDELLRLQRIVIGEGRFVKLGLREDGGFVGEHDRNTRLPLPEHISASPKDLKSLTSGMIRFDKDYAAQLDPIMAAAILAFGFVYVHPFEDGNGRLHRYLVHHVLARRGFTPPGLVFPISAAILDKIEEYRRVLEDYSKRLLPVIEWEPTLDNNVRVLNETTDFYRYFDATAQVEFLYECVAKTIEKDLPEEAKYLQRYDTFKNRVEELIEMPASTVDLLFNFLKQNEGQLSKRAQAREFSKLTKEEVASVEDIYREIFWSAL